jgi:hypothetical protein
VTDKLKPKPVGSRPRCLACNRELKPNYGYDVPFQIFMGDDHVEKRRAFEREHKIFRGTYGRNRDNRFCGINCGYDFAIAHTKPK